MDSVACPSPLHPHSRLDEVAVMAGEMREFMRHTRSNLEDVTKEVGRLASQQAEQDRLLERHNDIIVQTHDSVKELHASIGRLHSERKSEKEAAKTTRKAWLKGIGIGTLIMALASAVYYKDTALLQMLYKHTLGLLL